MRTIPPLKKKRRTGIDPDSLTAALCWDRIADPGVPADDVVDGAQPIARGETEKGGAKTKGTPTGQNDA